MNAKERLHARLSAQAVDRIPNLDIFTVFAAHYIKQPLSMYYLDYRVLSEANLALLAPFAIDIVQATSDPYREAADFGVEILFPEDAPPHCARPLLLEAGDLLKLQPPNPYTGRRMSDRLMAVRYLNEQVGNEVPVMGWVEGPLSLAATLRGFEQLVSDFYQHPQWVHELLEVCTQVVLEFARLQAAMGGVIIGVGEKIACQIPLRIYQAFALPYQQRLVNAIHETGALARLHTCGNTSHLLSSLPESGADIIDLDWMVNLQDASALFNGRAAPCGNMNARTIFLDGTAEAVRQDTRRAIRQGGACLLSAAGCEILDGTPEENLLAQAEVLGEGSE